MNEGYPSSTGDYDMTFLSPLVRSVFKKDELKECGKTGYIKHLNREKLRFVKGKGCCENMESIYFQWMLLCVHRYIPRKNWQ